MNTKATLDLLRAYESPNVLFIDPDGTWPIVWERAKGMYVWDAEGKKYLDMTAAFGVAAAGHANTRVITAGKRQMGQLLHAMGDVHPHFLKARLARELSRLTFERWGSPAALGKTIFCNSGFEAVESALKTAMLATGRSKIIAFAGAYHGLGYGALSATHREHFRGPFRSQLREFGLFAPFPTASEPLDKLETTLRRFFRKNAIGAILVEPIQARGGINVPPPEFLPLLRKLCDEFGALLILDEIYTGFGRTGKWFACEHSKTIPDLICLGKALTGGFPLSACVGRAAVMDAAWPVSSGEAIHTSTFLGHPVGCAMALAQIKEIDSQNLVEQSAKSGQYLLAALRDRMPQLPARGMGLMAGLEFNQSSGKPDTMRCLDLVKKMLQRGYILLPEGESGNIISFTPPLIVTKAQLDKTVDALAELVSKKCPHKKSK